MTNTQRYRHTIPKGFTTREGYINRVFGNKGTPYFTNDHSGYNIYKSYFYCENTSAISVWRNVFLRNVLTYKKQNVVKQFYSHSYSVGSAATDRRRAKQKAFRRKCKVLLQMENYEDFPPYKKFGRQWR